MEAEHKYRECLRNHAASLGSYATDGCGEFTLDGTSPATLQCTACRCHRNFHRKITYSSSSHGRQTTVELVDYGGDCSVQRPLAVVESPEVTEISEKKRFRVKFTVEQKEKMLGFAEKLGWKLQRKNEDDEVERFCRGVGVSRQVFKVWMHNHKNSSSSASTGNASSLTTDQ
ncbi:hypothetical protein Q3G72_029112 [Acer saccharum]|nr:hypothetical protein Q3G72_029112 [Acer saccharum]